jgi:hypothetical protein
MPRGHSDKKSYIIGQAHSSLCHRRCRHLPESWAAIHRVFAFLGGITVVPAHSVVIESFQG